MKIAESVSVIIVPPSEIDERGVHAANLDGMRRAVKGLSIEPAYVLTDGYAIEGLAIPNVAVWKGDQVVHAISAASIIAKVVRDRIMRQLDVEYPSYGFAVHKGYITAADYVDGRYGNRWLALAVALTPSTSVTVRMMVAGRWPLKRTTGAADVARPRS